MRRGFTIIELLIVIAVISVLVGIALPRFRGMQVEGLYAQAKGELRTLQSAVESYYIHNGAYPATFPDDIEGATPDIIGATAPTDPFTSSSDYGYDTTGGYYIIWSVGPGGTATITGIDADGALEGAAGDDIYVSNAFSTIGG